MENNNSKQAILSIVGIAILVIAVVGVSFAFFTYSRTGEKNNIITTGSITFDLKPGGSGDLPEGANSVKYVVYAIKGTAPVAEVPSGADAWGELPPEAIKMYLEVDKSTGGTVTNDYETAAVAKAFSENTGNSEMGFKLAEGTITAGSEISHKYKLHMWITTDFNSGKIVSDTDKDYKYRASATTVGDLPAGQEEDTRLVWTDQYYAVKIKVVASDDPNFNKGA